MQTAYLQEGADRILQYLREVPYSDATVRYYGFCFENVLQYCETENIKQFDYTTAQLFFESQKLKSDNGEMSFVYALTQRKAAFALADYLATGKIDWKRRYYGERKLNTGFQTVADGFVASIASGLATGSVDLIVHIVRRFLFFLEDQGYSTIKELTELKPVQEFIIQEAPKHKGNRVNLTWPIKKFMIHLASEGLIAFNVASVFMNPVPNRKKVFPCFEDEEIIALFDSVDTTTPLGKRDFAIMKLALSTGARSSDLRNLRLQDVDWRRNEIHFIQQKTNTDIVLPLLPEAGNAVADYILNARPKSDEPYIFLRTRRPFTKLAASSTGTNILNRCRSKTSLTHITGDGKTFHAFRRTAGTNLIRSGATLAMTSQLLGHQSPDSTRRYLSLHDEMLSECCMDMSELLTQKEGLA